VKRRIALRERAPAVLAEVPVQGSSVAFALCAASALSGCAALRRPAYTPEALRREVALIAPAISPAELVIPFELPEPALATARRVVLMARTDDHKAELLVEAMFDPRIFGLTYDDTANFTAAEALATKRGNCVALASVFIGLARAVRLDARYIDASVRVHETHYDDDGATVNVGHVTALVTIGVEHLGMDFANLGPFRWYRELDDLEALAHFYNNRGYEHLANASERGVEPDWALAEHQFRLALAVKPGFARAWNNLGIAQSHLGHGDQAQASFREAIALDPLMAAPLANLGRLRLETGDLPGALESLQAAAALEPQGAHIQYNLAVARMRSGDLAGAIEALRETVRLHERFPGAQALLEQLELKALTP
jgi:Tetratricopeptide repeat/Transglutaminase-like superfamily